jgi:hypothetical protein
MNLYRGFTLLIVDDHAHNLFTLRSLIETHMDVAVLEADRHRHHPQPRRHRPHHPRRPDAGDGWLPDRLAAQAA